MQSAITAGTAVIIVQVHAADAPEKGVRQENIDSRNGLLSALFTTFGSRKPNSMNKIAKWGMVGIAIAGIAVFGISRMMPHQNKEMQKGGPAAGPGGSRPLYVRAIIAKNQSLEDGINISGSLIPNEEVNLSFEKSGKITGIYFEEGKSVRKGDLLAKINDAPLQAQLKRLEAQLKLNEDRLFRQKTLLEREAVSQETFQEAEASLMALRAQIEEIHADIDQTELRAPFDGIVGLRQVSLGAYASPSTNVATLTSTSKLKVEFAVPERYAGVLKPGAPLTFSVEGDNKQYSAKVYAVNSIVDSETRTYTVRAIYDNSDGQLVPGRYVSVSLVTRIFDDAISVPSEAIISEMGIDKVFLYKSGKAFPVEIKKGLRTDASVQIVEGIALGDTIITSGTMQLRTGSAVELKELK